MSKDVLISFDDAYTLIRDRAHWLHDHGEEVPDEICRRVTTAMNAMLRERWEAKPPAERRPPDPPVVPWKPKAYS
jgi:hypothetical protein